MACCPTPHSGPCALCPARTACGACEVDPWRPYFWVEWAPGDVRPGVGMLCPACEATHALPEHGRDDGPVVSREAYVTPIPA